MYDNLKCSWALNEPKVFTFSKRRNLKRKADDAHQILNGDQRPQDGPNPQSLTFTSLDQL